MKRNGGKFSPNCELLEDRLTPTSPVPVTPPVAAATLGQAPGGGSAASEHRPSIILAMAEDRYPLPHQLHQPPQEGVRPFAIDAGAMYFAVITKR